MDQIKLHAKPSTPPGLINQTLWEFSSVQIHRLWTLWKINQKIVGIRQPVQEAPHQLPQEDQEGKIESKRGRNEVLKGKADVRWKDKNFRQEFEVE